MLLFFFFFFEGGGGGVWYSHQLNLMSHAFSIYRLLRANSYFQTPCSLTFFKRLYNNYLISEDELFTKAWYVSS